MPVRPIAFSNTQYSKNRDMLDRKKFIADNFDALDAAQQQQICADILVALMGSRYGIKMERRGTSLLLTETKWYFDIEGGPEEIHEKVVERLEKAGVGTEDLRIWQNYKYAIDTLHIYQTAVNVFHGDTKMRRMVVDFFLWLSTGEISADMTKAGQIVDLMPTPHYGHAVKLGEIEIKMFLNSNIRVTGFNADMQERFNRFKNAQNVFKK